MKAVILGATALAVMLTTSCASRCESLCEKSNACTITQRAFDYDCYSFCGEVDAMQKRAVKAEQANCNSEWSAYLSCWESNQAKICDKSFTDCQEKAQAWTTCMTPYCASLTSGDPSEPSCAGSKPVLVPF